MSESRVGSIPSRKSVGDSAAGEAIRQPVPLLLLTDDECASALGVSVRTFRQLVHQWEIPPVVLGPRLVRWRLEDLQQAIARAPRQVQRSEPAELARSRIERMKKGPP